MSASPAAKERSAPSPAPAAVAPAPSPSPAPAASPPAPARQPSRVAAAALSVIAGVIVLLGLAAGYALPDSLPLIAPLVVLIAAVGLWGAARIDQSRLAEEAARLRAETGQDFAGRPPGLMDFRVRVGRARQRRAALLHASQVSPGAVLWRRLQLQGEYEHLRWLVPPSAAPQ